MENESRPIIQNCYINGLICRNGKRSDFQIDPVTEEKPFCNKWIKIVGTDPQSGKEIETWCCSEFAKIKLALENSAMTRRVVASVDRNNHIFFEALPPVAKERVLQKGDRPQLEDNHGIQS